MEAPNIKTEEELDTEAQLQAIQTSNTETAEAIRQATEALATAEGGNKSYLRKSWEASTPLIKNWKAIPLALGLIGTDYVASEKLGEYAGGGAPTEEQKMLETHTPQDRRDYFQSKAAKFKRESDKLAKAKPKDSKVATPKPKSSSPETTASTNRTPTLEEITAKLQAKFDEESAKRDAAFSNKLAALENFQKTNTASVAAVKPKVETFEEKVERLKAKVTAGELLAEDEDQFWNGPALSYLEKRAKAERLARNAEIERAAPPRTSATPRIAEPDPASYVHPYQPPTSNLKEVNVTAGGMVNAYKPPVAQTNVAEVNLTAGGTVGAYTPPVMQTNSAPKETITKNPFKLSDEMLEKAEEVYENNIEKIFPSDTLKSWREIKDKPAYELMSTAEKKVPKKDRALFSYLQKLKDASTLEPKSGVRGKAGETIEQYIERALQKSAQMKKLAEVTLK